MRTAGSGGLFSLIENRKCARNPQSYANSFLPTRPFIHEHHVGVHLRRDIYPHLIEVGVIEADRGAEKPWIAAGLFEPAVREKAGLRWTPGDEVLLRLFGKLVELAFLAVPDEIRLHPRALAAYRRAEGRLPDDAPLVQAPAFMAPPRDRRGLPMHYFPPRPRSALDPALQPARALIERAGSLVHGTLSLAGLRPARGRGRRAA